MDTEPKTQGIYPIVAGYIATHGMSRIADEDTFKSVIKQVIEAASEDISPKDMVSLINVVIASR